MKDMRTPIFDDNDNNDPSQTFFSSKSCIPNTTKILDDTNAGSNMCQCHNCFSFTQPQKSNTFDRIPTITKTEIYQRKNYIFFLSNQFWEHWDIFSLSFLYQWFEVSFSEYKLTAFFLVFFEADFNLLQSCPDLIYYLHGFIPLILP